MLVKTVRFAQQFNSRFCPHLRPFFAHLVAGHCLHQPVQAQRPIRPRQQRVALQGAQGLVPRQRVGQHGRQVVGQAGGMVRQQLQRDVVRGQEAAQVQQVGRPGRLPRPLKANFPGGGNRRVVIIRRGLPLPQLPPPRPVQVQVAGRIQPIHVRIRRRLLQRQRQIAQLFCQLRRARFVKSLRFDKSLPPKIPRLRLRKHIQPQHRAQLMPVRAARGNQHPPLRVGGQPGAQGARLHRVGVVAQQQPPLGAAVQPGTHHLHGRRLLHAIHRQPHLPPQRQKILRQGLIHPQPPDHVIQRPLPMGKMQHQLALAHPAHATNRLGNGRLPAARV
ncbi:MAG: hypothetical protein IPF56_08425 [Chloroflexi bacterium]|nr:hypothetical protein [Chloroflexota bacterium]